MAIGINWKEIWKPVWKPVWTFVAPPAGGEVPLYTTALIVMSRMGCR